MTTCLLWPYFSVPLKNHTRHVCLYTYLYLCWIDIQRDIADIWRDIPDIQCDILDIRRDIPDIRRDMPDIRRCIPDIRRDIPDILNSQIFEMTNYIYTVKHAFKGTYKGQFLFHHLVNNPYHLNLYIMGNYSKGSYFQVPFSAFYIQVWLYSCLHRVYSI